MSIVLLTILASALQGAIAFQTTSTGCVTCGPPPDSSASSCVAVFGDLVIGAGGPNSNIETAEGNGFCCAQSSTSCASFASDTGLENIAEDCDAACANIFASNSSSTGGSTAASPGGSASTVGTQAAPAAAPAISVVSTSPTPAGSTTGKPAVLFVRVWCGWYKDSCHKTQRKEAIVSKVCCCRAHRQLLVKVNLLHSILVFVSVPL